MLHMKVTAALDSFLMVKEQRAWMGHRTCVAYASKSGSPQRSCSTTLPTVLPHFIFLIHFKWFSKPLKQGFFNWCTTLELELTLKEIERKIKSHKRWFLSRKSQIPAVGTSKQLIRIIRLLKKSLITYCMDQIGISCSMWFLDTCVVTKSICASLHSPFSIFSHLPVWHSPSCFRRGRPDGPGKGTSTSGWEWPWLP